MPVYQVRVYASSIRESTPHHFWKGLLSLLSSFSFPSSLSPFVFSIFLLSAETSLLIYLQPLSLWRFRVLLLYLYSSSRPCGSSLTSSSLLVSFPIVIRESLLIDLLQPISLINFLDCIPITKVFLQLPTLSLPNSKIIKRYL